MNCKFCNEQIPEDSSFCPVCGKELNAEETAPETVDETVAEAAVTEETVAEEAAVEETVAEEAAAEEAAVEETAVEEAAVEEAAVEEAAAEEQPAKASTKKITAAVIAVVLVAAILIGLVAGGLGGKPAADPTTSVTEETEPVVIPSNGDPSSPQCKASYTVSDEEAAAVADVVVATMEGKTLTNAQLQAFYWQELYMFLNEYGSYAPYMGLDVYAPLDQQLMMGGMEDGSDVSWQQFFLDGAIDTWKNYQAMELAAESIAHQMPADMQKELDEMPANLEAAAVSGGFKNADDMIRQRVGALCELDSYMEYTDTYYRGMAYYTYLYENLNPTDAEVEAFFAENEDYFKENGVTRDARFVNVRHVLLQPEGGEAGEDGYPVYTDEAWEACRVKVEEIYTKWQEGDKSEDSFAQVAMDYSVDSSAANGGLYENVFEGQMVEEFENWCFDESRQPGDHGLVKTRYGYHIMFFSAHRSWLDLAREGMIDSLAYDLIPDITEQYTAQVDYSLVSLSHINFG